MIKLKGNWLLWQILGVYAVFLVAGDFVIPKPFMSSGTAIMALIAGALMAMRYAGTAAEILLSGRRGEYGAHNAVLGAAEFAFGLVYSGIYRLAFVYFNQPHSWLSSVWGAVGLFMIAKGCFRLAISPDDVTPGHRFPEGFKMIALWVFGLVIAFVAGTHFASFGQ